MKKVKLLLCMLSLMSLVVLTACDDDDDNGSGGGGGGGGGTAATNLAGSTMTVTVDDPPENAGTYTITFVDDSSYTSDFGDGTYTYEKSGNTAQLTLDPADSEDTIHNALTFDSGTSGSIQTESTDVDGNVTISESGTFTLSSGSSEPTP